MVVVWRHGVAVVVLENVRFAVCSSCRSSSSLEVVVESRQRVAVVGLVVVVESRGNSPW